MSPDGGGASLDYLYSRNPEPGAIIEVAPGVLWLTMPLPSSLNHINLWLLEDGDGVAIVDTGIFSQVTRDHWLRHIGIPREDLENSLQRLVLMELEQVRDSFDKIGRAHV